MTERSPIVTRFAPSPTGYLHLGHAYAALFAAQAARHKAGRFLVRIEDIDTGRCRAEFEDAIYEDLAWLGLNWEHPVRRQSDCMTKYQDALTRLDEMGVIYPCFCTRKDIVAEIQSAGGAPHLSSHPTAVGPDGPLYPGTCRKLSPEEGQAKTASGKPFALRLDIQKALQITGPLHWTDSDRGEMTAEPEIFGDVILARKDTPTSYHLSVTLDDHIQGITLVTRGEDLLLATHIHRTLQALLGLCTPCYRHHGLLKGADGLRLAKRDKAATIRSLRESGHNPAEVCAMAGFSQVAREN